MEIYELYSLTDSAHIRPILWASLDLEGWRRGGCMGDGRVIEMPGEIGIGNDGRVVRILCGD